MVVTQSNLAHRPHIPLYTHPSYPNQIDSLLLPTTYNVTSWLEFTLTHNGPTMARGVRTHTQPEEG